MDIEEIRKRLLSTNQSRKVSGVEELKRQLSDKKTRKSFIIKTISADVSIILTSILALRDESLQRSILVCWEVLSEDEHFYKNNVATSVIMKILETGTLIAVNQPKEQSILIAMAYTLAVLFYRARVFKVSLKITKFINQILVFIKYFNVKSLTDHVKITAIGNFFYSIVVFVDPAKISLDTLQMIQETYTDMLMVISKVSTAVIQKENKESFKTILSTALGICSTALNFAGEDERSLNSDSEDSSTNESDKRLEISKDIFNLSCKKMLDIVIPNFKKFDDSSCEFKDTLKNFITFFNGLYEQEHNMKYIEQFSFDLSVQGYLTYFLEKIQNPDFNYFKQSLCRCLARILTNLTHRHLSMEQWEGDLRGFCKFIYDGLMSCTESEKLTTDSPSADALLFCDYFHYQATKDLKVIENIGQMPLSKKILDLSIENPPPVPIVQVIWFFISEWMLKSTTVDSDKCLPDALTHLIEILLKVGVEKCYIYYPALVVTVLQNPIFPREIRHQVVKLWLEKSGDVYTLVNADHKDVVVDALIYALKTGSKDVAKRALKDLIEISKDTNPMNFDFTSNVWEQIFDNLTNHKKENEHNFEGLLKLANELMTTDLTVVFAMQSVVKFIIFFSCNIEINLNTKILLMKLTNKMFSIVLDDDNIIGIPSKIADKDILNEIRDQAFNKSNNDLSVACLKCLKNIIIILTLSSQKLSQPLSITSDELVNALSENIQVALETMMLLNTVCVKYKNYSDFVAIDFCENNIERDIYEIYNLLIEVHDKVVQDEWEITFNCLTNFLMFVQWNFSSATSDCSDNISTHLAIIKTIDCSYFHAEFLKFVNLWLEQGLQSNCSFVDGIELNRMKINSQDYFRIESTFEKTLKQLKTYIKQLDASSGISMILLEKISFRISLIV